MSTGQGPKVRSSRFPRADGRVPDFLWQKKATDTEPTLLSHRGGVAVRSRNQCCPGSKTGLVCCHIGPVAQCKACPWSPRAIGPKWNLPSPGKGGGLATQSGKAKNPSLLCVQLPLRVGVSKQSFPTSSRAEGPPPVLHQSTPTSPAGGAFSAESKPHGGHREAPAVCQSKPYPLPRGGALETLESMQKTAINSGERIFLKDG